MSLTFTTASPKDISRIVDWDEQAAVAATGDGFSVERKAEHAEVYRETLRNPNIETLIVHETAGDSGCGVLVVEYGRGPESITEVVGLFETGVANPISLDEFLAIARNEEPANPRAHLKLLAIDNAYRGRGMGKLVMRELISRLRARGITLLSLSTGTQNRPMQRVAKDATFVEVRSAKGGYRGTKLIGIMKIG